MVLFIGKHKFLNKNYSNTQNCFPISSGVNCFDGSAVALKYQRPSNLATWELYICTEVKKRIKNPDIVR